MRKLMDVGRLAQMGWSARIRLEQGLAYIYEWYLANAQSKATRFRPHAGFACTSGKECFRRAPNWHRKSNKTLDPTV